MITRSWPLVAKVRAARPEIVPLLVRRENVTGRVAAVRGSTECDLGEAKAPNFAETVTPVTLTVLEFPATSVAVHEKVRRWPIADAVPGRHLEEATFDVLSLARPLIGVPRRTVAP